MNNKNVIKWIVIATALAFLAFIFLINYSKSDTEVAQGDYDSFAQCLTESNLIMYGSATCSVCAKQRKSFGDSFEFIKEIECDPRNENPQTELCISKNITHTPTWILEDEDGNDLFRFEAGFVKLKDLGDKVNCPLIKDSELEVNANKS